MSAAPDYVEPIVGWRSWLVVEEGDHFTLRSVVHDAYWLPRTELVARCLRWSHALPLPWRRRSEHVPPVRGCGCGIYATREPEAAASYLEGRSWGDTVSVHRAEPGAGGSCGTLVRLRFRLKRRPREICPANRLLLPAGGRDGAFGAEEEQLGPVSFSY